MTYRGHAVFQTLIRCHFSPAETTGGAYLYSGSADAKVYVRNHSYIPWTWANPDNTRISQIWSLDGTLVQVLDRRRSLPISFDPSAPEVDERPLRRGHESHGTVRDVSWHSSVSDWN